MKKTLIYLSSLCLTMSLTQSCTDMLNLESNTSVTSGYIYSTPEGLARAAVGLYVRDRSTMTGGTEGSNGVAWLLDGATDIALFRAGNPANHYRLENMNASDNEVKNWWKHFYNVIGKANEIIAAAEGMDMNNRLVLQSWSEAKTFRARSYFELYKRWDRILLSTEPTTADNLDQDFYPATPEEVFERINEDLQDVIDAEGLSYDQKSPVTGETENGRLTMAVVRHIKAQVALWQRNWDEAILQTEEIFKQPQFSLMPRSIDCFTGADLNYAENLYVLQFSPNIGGGNSVTSDGTVIGHRMSLVTTPALRSVIGEVLSEYGGYGWGRVYPNTYLFSLYNADDERLNTMFQREYVWPEGSEKAGQVITSPGDVSKSNYTLQLHPMNMKYFDKWTNADEADRRSSFKDIVIYRLAETYLIAAEAYMRKGDAAKALECYNKVWERSNPAPFAGPLNEENLVEEYARELNFEGVRFGLLKRLGLLEQQVTKYQGNSTTENPLLSTSCNQARAAFRFYHNYWPIPQTEVDLMGVENYPQNAGWE